MVTIIFETHSTSTDNEAGISSGWSDPNLSKRGKEQAKELGQRRKNDKFDAVFCADMERAYQTASIAFGRDPRLIYCDWRLREWNYGVFTGKKDDIVAQEKLKRIKEPFPVGESALDFLERMQSFLEDLKIRFKDKTVLIVGHRATHYALEHLINGKSIKQCISEPRPWQPGWKYKLG